MHNWQEAKTQIRQWGKALGFQAVGFAGVDLGAASVHLANWLAAGRHGEMDYMAAHGMKRARPAELVPGTQSIIVLRMNYGQGERDERGDALVAQYARGRDYHKVLRPRLQQLAQRINATYGPAQTRVFTDSAPVMEVELARLAGLGWRGKHTLLIDREVGSWFFLGEIFCSLPLPSDTPSTDHCGSCRACIDACPTGAITAPYQLDARRCISYLTIEHKSGIAPELRAPMANHIYGCDDCQTCCPWNRKAPVSEEADFAPRHNLHQSTLFDLLQWSAEDFAQRFAGSAIRRIGYARWQRNLHIAAENAAQP